jgi:crotonobetainyl-CoA:carnitine CoA-transferase CaiB-like acyl-CoA transferase
MHQQLGVLVSFPKKHTARSRRFSPTRRDKPTRLGRSTDEVLEGVLAISAEARAELRAARVI